MLSTVVLFAATIPGRAALLNGTVVTGSLTFNSNPTNYYDPANGFTGGCDLSTQAAVNAFIPGLGFCFQSTKSVPGVGVSQNFVTLDDTSIAIASFFSTNSGGNFDPWQQVFIDETFVGLTMTLSADSFPGGLSASLNGDTLTVNWAGAPIAFTQADSATITFSTGTPEPSTMFLCPGALLGLALLRQSKRRQSRVRTVA